MKSDEDDQILDDAIAQLWAQIEEDDTKLRRAAEEEGFISTTPVKSGDEIQKLTILDGDATAEAEGQTEIPKVVRTFDVSGPPGARVKMYAVRVADSGGHHHSGRTQHTGAVGVLSRYEFTLGGGYPQRVPIDWTLPEVSGSVMIVATFSRGNPAGGIADIYYVNGLVALKENQTLRLKAPTPQHLSPYWVTPQMGVALQGAADEFYLATGKLTTITDGSLQYGGLFDIRGNWAPPHRTHRDGKVVDARIYPFSEDERQLFERLCRQRGLQADRHTNPDHWHIRFL